MRELACRPFQLDGRVGPWPASQPERERALRSWKDQPMSRMSGWMGDMLGLRRGERRAR